MSTAILFNIPNSPEEWGYWLLANADEHQQLVTAISAQKNVTLESYVLNPAPERDYQQWLLVHQKMHSDLDSVLGIGGNDYTSLDFENPVSVEYIWQQHANEHILARSALGI